MPRQDVPYGGAICRLRERIAEIFDKLGEKLHTINGVPGDGDGNVKIVSGSSAVVITNDPTQNEIAVSLDTSQLPAAAVSSVNGQTGAVALTADDIPSDNGDVQTDIDNLAAADVTLQGNINAEALARQGADSTLQTNINAVLASIPDMSVTPDPYKGVERDAQGRAFAADPASGATDKTLTTANWISQSGDTGPNNLIHKNGSETKTGTFTVSMVKSGNAISRNASNVALLNATNDYIEGYHIRDKDGNLLMSLNCLKRSDDSVRFYVNVRNADGSFKRYYLADGDQ